MAGRWPDSSPTTWGGGERARDGGFRIPAICGRVHVRERRGSGRVTWAQSVGAQVEEGAINSGQTGGTDVVRPADQLWSNQSTLIRG